MKQHGSLTRVVCFAAAAACAALVSSVQAAPEVGKAVVRSVHGQAQFSEGTTWNNLQSGQVLKAGTVVRTANDSSVDLFLDENGPLVRLLENTTLGLDKLNFETTGVDVVVETQLDLRSGNIVGIVKKLSAASKYEVKTPNGVAGVRGTGFRAFATGVTQVFEGSMVSVFVKPTGAVQTESLSAGDQFDPATGKGPISKTDLAQGLALINSLRGIPESMNEVGPYAAGRVASSTAQKLAAGANNQIGYGQVPVIAVGFDAGNNTSVFVSPPTAPSAD